MKAVINYYTKLRETLEQASLQEIASVSRITKLTIVAF